MLSVEEAVKIVQANLPGCGVKKYIDYKEVFVFQVFLDDPLEGTCDPFYSVNKETSAFEGFALFAPGVFSEVMQLFTTAKNYN